MNGPKHVSIAFLLLFRDLTQTFVFVRTRSSVVAALTHFLEGMLRLLNRNVSLSRRSAALSYSLDVLCGSRRSFSDEKDKKDGVVSVLPTKVGFGEQSPRFPHTVGLPLVSRPLFPGLVTSITLSDSSTIEALEGLPKDKNYVSCFLRKSNPMGVSEGGVILPSPEVISDPSDIFNVGTFAQVQSVTRANTSSHADEEEAANSTSESATVILLAHRRVDLTSVDELGPPLQVTVNHWDPSKNVFDNEDTIQALSNEIISTIREVAQVNLLFRENLQYFPMRIDANDPYRLADFAASISASGTPEDLQAVLEQKDPEQRLHQALQLLNRERQVSRLQQEISSKVEEQMTQAQRKYFLNEQLKNIKKELGVERDDKEALLAKYREQMKEHVDVPKEARETIESEMEKFSTLEKNSPEYNVTRSYLDWLIGIPWGKVTEENFDLIKARQVLDSQHYGMDDVKDTILQFIAIGKLRGTVQGKILCLSGPPGTGKTSIAKSVAESLGREFFRFSVGGLSDVSEIKGHRR